MRFLRKIKGITIFDKVCNTAIRESLNIESRLLRIEIFQVRWFDSASKIPQERLIKQTLYVKVIDMGPVEQPQTRWLDYMKDLGCNHMRLRSREMQSVFVNKACGGLTCSCCLGNPQRTRVKKKKLLRKKRIVQRVFSTGQCYKHLW